MENETAVATINHNQLIHGQNEGEEVYCSFKPKTSEEKLDFFNMLNHCTGRLNDMEGQVIRVKHVYLQKFNRRDKETGEERIGRRTIVITPDGKSYVTMSSYFALELGKLISVFGEPSKWEKPVVMKIVKREQKGAQGNILQFELVKENKPAGTI